MPQSYVTLSHLWPSVAHESARSSPATSCSRLGSAQRPQAEGAVDVQPARSLGEPVGDRVERVERPGVDLAGLGADEHRAGEVGQLLGAHPALVVGRDDDDALAAEPDEPERLGQRRVRPLADDDVERRCAEEPVRLRVPAEPRRARRRGRRRGTAALATVAPVTKATPVPAGSRSRSTSQPRDDVVQRGGHRRHHRQRGVLVPRARQPRAAERDRVRRPGDEPEVAGAGRGDGRRAAGGVEQPQRVDGVDAVVGQRLVERGERLPTRRGRA